jgi:hypothetical protein
MDKKREFGYSLSFIIRVMYHLRLVRDHERIQ